jgi:hypothetical protein
MAPGLIFMTIDQSLSSTGVAVIAPVSSAGDVTGLLTVISSGLEETERRERLTAAARGLDGAWARACSRAGSGVRFSAVPLVRSGRWSSGPRKHKALVVATLLTIDDEIYLALSSRIPAAPSSDPEWLVARRNAAAAARIATGLGAYARQYELTELRVAMEGLAMGGSALTARILPILGIVWGLMFQEIKTAAAMMPESVTLTTWECPISSWKKAFTGQGGADKKMVEARLRDLLNLDGAALAFETSDEVDALAMALLLATQSSAVRATGGRIRPV